MNTIDFQTLAVWMREFFIYQQGSPLIIGSIPFALLFVVFLSVYVVLKNYSRLWMMFYVIGFSLFFAYKANGGVFLLLPLTAITNYWLTELIRLYESHQVRKALLTVIIVVDLSLLAIFKYYNFIVGDVLNQMLSTNFSLSSIVLPIGISFYTFQAISYAVDVYRGTFTMKVSQLEYYFYLTFFPLLMAGPITRARCLIPSLRRNQQASSRMLWTGLFLVMLGLIKKNLLSDYIAQYNNWVFDAPTTFSGFENVMAMIGYAPQLYLDFSGYSDMSIGVVAIMGFWLPDNFWFPYRALNLTDFWRRWHISLSTWFRDYVYIPLGGNRNGTFRMYLNNFLTMLVAGLWHGASWMFVIWGALHGLGLVVHKFFSRQLGLSFPSKWWGNLLSWVITYVYVTFAFTFFRAVDLPTLFSMFSKVRSDFSWAYFVPFWNARAMWCVCLLMIFLSYAIPERFYVRLQLRFITLPWFLKFILFTICLQLVIEFSQQNVQPFIYTQF